MTGAERYRKILSVLLPAGVLGTSILLGSASAEAAREVPAGPPPGLAPPQVAERLAAIRDAVSDVATTAEKAGPGSQQLAWGNVGVGVGIGGFGIGIGVPAWNDWHNGWKNWGNNWKNGWNNWGNGWNNY